MGLSSLKADSARAKLDPMAQYTALAQQESPDAVLVITPGGKVLHWDQGAEALFGFSASDAMGRSILELTVPPDQHLEEAEFLAATISQGIATFESLRRRKDGSLLYVCTTNKAVADPATGAKLILSTKKDVTQLRVQRDSQRIELKFRNLLENVPDAIVIMNAAGHIVYANEHALHLFGYAPGELPGEPIETLLPPRFRSAHLGHRVGYFAQPRPRSMGIGLELFGLRKDGSEFSVEIGLSPLQVEDTTFAMSAIRDVSVRTHAQARFRGLLESAPDAIVIIDGRGRIVLVNSQTERLFGYQRTELLGQPVEFLIPERYRARHTVHRGAFVSDPRVRPMGASLDLYAKRKDGSEFPVEISLSPLETDEGTLVTSAIRDITERKRIEQELLDKNLALEKADRAKNQFLASMSHELRTPLNSVIGFTGTLLMKLPGPLNAEQEHQLRNVQKSARHLLSLINDLLDLAKIEADKLELTIENLDCTAGLKEVADTLRPLAESKGLEFILSIPESPMTAAADPRALRQILLNLIGNAIKFTDTGFVRLGLRRGTGTNSELVEICVEDSGPGIEGDDLAQMFSPFTRFQAGTRPPKAGTGLGLYLSQKLATLMGGTIDCNSTPGHGATFLLSLRAG